MNGINGFSHIRVARTKQYLHIRIDNSSSGQCRGSRYILLFDKVDRSFVQIATDEKRDSSSPRSEILNSGLNKFELRVALDMLTEVMVHL